jgi:hypothetical protein
MIARRRVFYGLVLALFLASTLAGCSASANTAAPSGKHELHMAPVSDMPDEVKSAPVVTQQAYQFAVANPDVAKQVPCYCGCGAMGHTSSYSCYVQGIDDKGRVIYDPHALGCSICVDITQDTMRLLREGRSPQDIKAYVDKTYSRYGPSNMQ